MLQTESAPLAAALGRARVVVVAALRQLHEQAWFALSLRALSIGWPIVLVGYLAVLLAQLGWSEIWRWRAAHWTFYALLLAPFFVAPLADLIIYRRLWNAPRPLGLSVFLRKRFMNNVLDYSGELYFFVWAKRHLALREAVVAHSIKDSNLLSAAAPLLVLAAVVAVLTLGGHWRLPAVWSEHDWLYLSVIFLPLLLCALLLVGRRRLTALSGRGIAFVFSVHAARSLANYALEVTLWSLAMPQVPLVLWLNLLAVRIIIGRLSFLPHKDLTFVTAAVGMAGMIDLPQAGVAAVLLAITAADLLLNFVFLGVPALARFFARPSAVAAIR